MAKKAIQMRSFSCFEICKLYFSLPKSTKYVFVKEKPVHPTGWTV